MDYIFYKAFQYYKERAHLVVTMGIYWVFVIQLSICLIISLLLYFSLMEILHPSAFEHYFYIIFPSSVAILFTYDLIRYSRREKRIAIFKRYGHGRTGITLKPWHILSVPFILLTCIFLLFFFFPY